MGALDQEITPSGVNQVMLSQVTTGRREINRTPLLPRPTQAIAPWKFTCESEANTVEETGQD